MTTEQPDRDAYNATGILEAACPDCGAGPGQWCVADDGTGVRRIPCVGRIAGAVRSLRGGDTGEHPNLRAAVDDWQERRPRKELPQPPKPADDLDAAAHQPGWGCAYLDDDGPQHTGPVTVSRPYMPKPK